IVDVGRRHRRDHEVVASQDLGVEAAAAAALGELRQDDHEFLAVGLGVADDREAASGKDEERRGGERDTPLGNSLDVFDWRHDDPPFQTLEWAGFTLWAPTAAGRLGSGRGTALTPPGADFRLTCYEFRRWPLQGPRLARPFGRQAARQCHPFPRNEP